MSAWITGAEFCVTDTGLYGIIKLMQRKGDGIRTRLNKGFMSWKIRLVSVGHVLISCRQRFLSLWVILHFSKYFEKDILELI